jgi:hypothetical protein
LTGLRISGTGNELPATRRLTGLRGQAIRILSPKFAKFADMVLDPFVLWATELCILLTHYVVVCMPDVSFRFMLPTDSFCHDV